MKQTQTKVSGNLASVPALQKLLAAPTQQAEAAPAGGQQFSARWCPLCGTQHTVKKGADNPWQPHITRDQLESFPALLAERDALREALGSFLACLPEIKGCYEAAGFSEQGIDCQNVSILEAQARAALALGGAK